MTGGASYSLTAYALTRSGGGLAPAESVPEDVAAHCFRSMCVPLRALRLIRESGVIGGAEDAAPSRAGPRRNVGSNYVRPATGQRRITARVMRPFGRRLPHTLPFPAHPRVASGQKVRLARSPHFRPSGNPTGWNRKRSVPLALLSASPARWVVRAAPQNATRPARAASRWSALEGEPPLRARFPSAVRFKLPVAVPFYARPGHPQLQAAVIHLFPHSCHEKCGEIFAPAPTLAAGITPAKPSCCLLIAR